MGLRAAFACIGALGAIAFGAASASAATQTAYVANFTSNSVTPINVATNTAGAEIKVGKGPEGLAITPDGRTAYVANEASNSVTPINVATNTAGAEIKVGANPVGVAITPLIPTVTKVAATSGPVTGDKVVTITGENLQFANIVAFGTIATSRLVVNEAGTEIGVVTPAQEVAGTVDVTVRRPGGTSAVAKKDHYKYLPVIKEVFPPQGSTAGGEIVEVHGAGFNLGENTNTFVFGTTGSPSSSCTAHVSCFVKTPPHAAGVVDVRVTVNGAESAKTKADQFTYF
jgi:YVTN family beta-propeller protein